MPTQQEYNVTKQRSRKLYSKFEILNYRFQKTDELEGVVVGSPSFTNESTSDIRRTCNIQIHPKDITLDIRQGSKIWLDKYIKVYLGILNEQTDEIVYTNMGIYLINNPSHTYSATDNTISIEGVDLMARLTGLRDGNLSGLEITKLSKGMKIRGIIIDTIQMFGFDRYIVDCKDEELKYDIEMPSGFSAFDILSQIRNIYPNYQIFFDIDGVFHFEPIPSGDNEQIMVNDDLWKDVLISYNSNISYDNVKNFIEILGKIHDGDIGCDDTVVENNYLKTNCSSITDLTDDLMFGFLTPKNMPTELLDNPQIKINIVDISGNIKETNVLNIRLEDGTIPRLEEEEYYVIRYKEKSNYYEFMGGQQAYGYAYDEVPNSPFNINGTAGVLRIVLSGGVYDSCTSDYLAKQMAEYELYSRCRLQDSVSIICVPIYWLDVNWVIEITLPNKQGIEETNKYIIKQIQTTYGSSSTQQISLMRYYPEKE